MEKIAIQCDTEEDWKAVKAKTKSSLTGGFSLETARGDCHGDGIPCISGVGGWNPRSRYIEDGYTIITAAEYLGGKDVKEFEVGDRVECVKPLSGSLRMGEVFTITGITNDADAWLELGELKRSQYYKPERFKLAGSATKPKTTKENKDMSININSTVAKVFKDVDEAALVTKWVGSEYEEDNHRAFMDLNKNSKLVLAYVIDLEKEEEAKK